jgi:hypothetical protein
MPRYDVPIGCRRCNDADTHSFVMMARIRQLGSTGLLLSQGARYLLTYSEYATVCVLPTTRPTCLHADTQRILQA